MESITHDTLRCAIDRRAKIFEKAFGREEDCDEIAEAYFQVVLPWIRHLSFSQLMIWNDYVFQAPHGMLHRVTKIHQMLHVLDQQRYFQTHPSCNASKYCLSLRARGSPMNKEYQHMRADHERRRTCSGNYRRQTSELAGMEFSHVLVNEGHNLYGPISAAINVVRSKYGKQSCEDFHFMMRCLYRYIPMPAFPTNSSRTEDRFVQVYGLRFGEFAERQGYLRLLDGEQRLLKEYGFDALHEWLTNKVIGRTDPFGWRGYTLTSDQIRKVSDQASHDWRLGWLS